MKKTNFKPNNISEMTDKDKISFQKVTMKKMGIQYIIMPEDSKKIMDKGGKTTDISKYWTHSKLDKLIKDNFDFDDASWYNIYILTDEGWRTVSKYSKKGSALNEIGKRILNFILDSDANEIGSNDARVYAVEIEEIGKKDDKNMFI